MCKSLQISLTNSEKSGTQYDSETVMSASEAAIFRDNEYKMINFG